MLYPEHLEESQGTVGAQIDEDGLRQKTEGRDVCLGNWQGEGCMARGCPPVIARAPALPSQAARDAAFGSELEEPLQGNLQEPLCFRKGSLPLLGPP